MSKVEELRLIHNIHVIAGALEQAEQDLFDVNISGDPCEYANKLVFLIKNRNNLLDDLKKSMEQLEHLINYIKN